MKEKISVYIHWPFCLSKCPYCDFTSIAISPRHSRESGNPQDTEAFLKEESNLIQSYLKEIDFYQPILFNRDIQTIYFGGGTPSLMHPKSVAAILAKLHQTATFANDIEITLEANPRTAETEKLKSIQQVGINRLSLGVQSFDNQRLHYLGRRHTAEEAQHAIDFVAKTFPRFSFDLIYGTPNQTLNDWHKELNTALQFNPKHLSLYQLTIEKGTPFYKNNIQELDENQSTAFFQTTNDIMTNAGIPAYEISNYASPGEESRHNTHYWTYDAYLGLGAGAHGRFIDHTQRIATQNLKSPTQWQNQINEKGNGLDLKETLTIQQAQTEALFMGLRQTKGINLETWKKKFNEDLFIFLPQQKREKLEKEGLLQQTPTTLFATKAGLQRLNAIIKFLL